MEDNKRPGENHEEPDVKRKKEDEENVLPRFSRACRICLADEPRYLCVFTPCGHVVCRACALKLRWDASELDQPELCSVCRGEGEYVVMKEELIKGIKDDEAKDVGTETPSEPTLSDRLTELNQNSTTAIGPSEPTLSDRLAELDEEPIEDMLLSAAIPMTRVFRMTQLAIEEAEDSAEMVKAAYDHILATEWAAYNTVCAYVEKSHTRIALESTACSVLRNEARAVITRCDVLIAGRSWTNLYATRQDAMEKRAELEETIALSRQSYDRLYWLVEDMRPDLDKTRERIERLRSTLMELNEESATQDLRFSRSCRVCNTESPPLRSFFPNCRHAVCRECADKADASEADAKKTCPICQTEGSPIPLFEETIET